MKINWNDWNNWDKYIIYIIICIISLIVNLLIHVFSAQSYLTNWICNRFSLSLYKGVIDLIVFICIFIILFFFNTFTIKSYIKDFILKRKFLPIHFRNSFGVVKNKIIPTMKNMVSTNSVDKNNKIDRYIQAPIEYVNEIVDGNQVPSFIPDDTYQNVIFDENIKYIIAITAENPNLWMDPTFSFYMANCYAVSLIKQINKTIDEWKEDNKRINKITVKNREYYEEKLNQQRKTIIDNLCNLNDNSILTNFEFIRFFMYTEEQKNSCNNTVFPSLKASQDLFRTHSFFINKSSLSVKNLNKWKEFSRIVKSLWSLFNAESFKNDGKGAKKILQKRKEKIIPEFLFLFYENIIEVHSYLDGNHVSESITAEDTYKSKEVKGMENDEHNISSDIKNLISLLAQYTQNKNYIDDLTFQQNKGMVNKQYAFIDWEEENIKSKRKQNNRKESI